VWRTVIWLLTALVACGALGAVPHRIALNSLVHAESHLLIANADGSEEHPLLASPDFDYDPAWSPDGRWIVFTSDRQGSADLYRVRPDGSQLQRLTDSPALDDQAAFSPDSRQLVFVSTRTGGHANLWILNLSTRATRALTRGSGGDFRPAWSPDGKWIAFCSDRGSLLPMTKRSFEHLQLARIYLIRPDGSGLRALTSQDEVCGSPKWASDSRRIVGYCLSAEETYTYRRFTVPEGGNTRLVTIDVNTGEQQSISAPGVKISPQVFPSGRIGYVRKSNTTPGIYYTDGGTGPTGQVRTASWSPDATRVVYDRIARFAFPDWKKTACLSSDYELIQTQAMPAFDPSGHMLAATGGRTVQDGQNTDLLLLDLKDEQHWTAIYRDTENRSVVGTQWSPDGQWLVFSLGRFFNLRARGARIVMIRPDGTDLRRLTSSVGNDVQGAWSPDGGQLLFLSARMGFKDEALYADSPQPYGELFVMRYDGSDVRQLTHNKWEEGFPTWQPEPQQH
jgi:Tol biopolymer transport system component